MKRQFHLGDGFLRFALVHEKQTVALVRGGEIRIQLQRKLELMRGQRPIPFVKIRDVAQQKMRFRGRFIDFQGSFTPSLSGAPRALEPDQD